MATNQPQIDPALLAQLLEGVRAAQAQQGAQSAQRPTTDPAEAPEAAQRPRRRSQSRTAGAGDLIAYLAAIGLGAAGWVIDGYFSLVALAELGLPVVAAIGWPWELSAAALAAWLIPVGVEAIEQVFFPTRARGWRLALFLSVAGLNVAAVSYGLWVAFAGAGVFGLQLAEGSRALWAVTIGGGLALAFLPGRLALAALRALLDLVR